MEWDGFGGLRHVLGAWCDYNGPVGFGGFRVVLGVDVGQMGLDDYLGVKSYKIRTQMK